MKTDQNRAKLRGNVAPQVAPVMVPEFPMHDWEATDLVRTSSIRTEQQAIKEGVNDPTIAEHLSSTRGRQVPSPDANAAVFQPHDKTRGFEKAEVRWEHGSESDSQYNGMDVQPGVAPGGLAKDPQFNAKTCIVGDMVTGPDPKAMDVGRKQIDAIVTGTLMSGGEFPRAKGPRVPLKDWPKDETKTYVNN